MAEAKPQVKTQGRRKTRMACRGDAWVPDRRRIKRPPDNAEVLLGKVEEGCNGCGKAVGNVDVHGVGGKCEKIKLPEEVPCLVA